MGLFKSKNEKSENENERSDDVAKKDKSEQAGEQAVPTDTPAEAANEGGLPEEDQKALVQFKSELPANVFENVQHLMTIMNPEKKGFEEMGGARWSPPVVKIRQAMTTEAPESANLGDIYTDIGDVFQRLEFTPLYMYKTRAKFEEDTPQPVCRSENAETNIYGQPCKECPDYQFKKGERQACAESINVLAFNKDMDQIYHLQFARTSFRAGFKLFRQASATARMWDRWYALQTEERTRQGSKSKYHVFTVTPTGDKVDPTMFPVLALFNEKITAVRQSILEKVTEREGASKQLVDQLDQSAFSGGDSSEGGDAPEPDFSTGNM
jgi:hypothetical protein